MLHRQHVGLDGDDERVSGTQDGLDGQPARIEFADVIIPGHGAPFRPGQRA